MNDFQQQYELWDEFLKTWPASRLATMTLDEYTQAGSKDSFTYWMETRLNGLGSIWGGSAFKFRVFSRRDTEEKQNDGKLSYSATHGWYSSLGSTAQEAFEKVRGFVVQVADWAAQGDLDAIESFEHLGEAFKWKIAFHYQNRQAPVILNVFKRAALAAYTGGTANQSMAVLQRAALAKRPANTGILEYGQQVWEAWSQNNQATLAGEATSPAQPAASKPVEPCFNRIYYGPPGTGKTYTLNRLLRGDCEQLREGSQVKQAQRHYSFITFVTFHQSYGYEEFVEGLRPVLAGDAEAGEVAYEIRPGVFKELCRKARQAPNQWFAMVIDEINRGNISKIFGELITLIEPDKREGMPNAVTVALPYSGELFSVPANVDIIGTMNTADRSLALLDTALRRRFDFEPLLPDTRDDGDAPLAGLRVSHGGAVINVPKMLERINERIEALYDRDHCIGHAYLTGLDKVKDGPERFKALKEAFRNRIVPLLEEYFFEDWHKIRLVLGDNQKVDSSI